MHMENIYNVNQAAFILKVHPLTIRRYIKEGRLKAIRAGGNVRIKETDLKEFNKEYSPNKPQVEKSPFRKAPVFKVFTPDDPFLRLRGRGASLNFSSV
jgi:excisionase family DNA binding protein